MKQNQLFCNKKAFVASYAMDFYAYLIFAVLIIAFFVIITLVGSPIDKPMLTAKAQLDLTTTLVNALKTQTESGLTAAEIISTTNKALKTQLQTTIKNTLATEYPEKNGVSHYWFNVYSREKNPEKPCEEKFTEFSYEKIEGLTGETSRDSANSAVYSTLRIPLQDKIDYVTAVLCVGGYNFK